MFMTVSPAIYTISASTNFIMAISVSSNLFAIFTVYFSIRIDLIFVICACLCFVPFRSTKAISSSLPSSVKVNIGSFPVVTETIFACLPSFAKTILRMY
jgi:hypothetical protein